MTIQNSKNILIELSQIEKKIKDIEKYIESKNLDIDKEKLLKTIFNNLK